MSPTARTLNYIRNHGGIAGVVERFNAYSRKRTDLLGFADVVGIWKGKVTGIQCCAGSGLAEHVKKLATPDVLPNVKAWIEAGGVVQVWSWRKLVRKKKDGTKSKVPRWAGTIRTISLTGEDHKEEIE